MQQEIRKIIQEKVIGVWEANHDEYGHRYLHKGKLINQRSVTTKLAILSKPHLTSWAVKQGALWLLQSQDRINMFVDPRYREDMIKGMQLAHTDIRDDAGHIGTTAHNTAERYINDWISSGFLPKDICVFAPPGTDPRSIASMRAVESFFKKNDIVPIASEILVGNTTYSAGTLDFLCLMNDKLTLIDFKTSNGVDELSYSLQVSAYKYFFEQMTGLKIHTCKILHLSKDYDRFSVYNVKKLSWAFKTFKSVCTIYDWIYDTSFQKIEKDIKKISI